MNKYKILIQSFLILFSSCSENCEAQTKNYSKITSYESEERIEFLSMKDTIVGYLSKPDHVSKFPVIVVLHSSGQGHHDNNLYNHLEKNMNKIGVGVFTYDRRGDGESGGNFKTSSFEVLAKDALQAIETLKRRNDVDSSRIGLFGISQGGWLAPLAYSITKKDISFMILVSSCGVSPAVQMEYSAVTTLKMHGYSENIISKATNLVNLTNAYFRGKVNRELAQKEINKYSNEEWFNDTYLSQNLPEDVSDTKWIHEMDFEPRPYFESVDIPLLLFYGQKDRWVPIQESINVWTNALKVSGNYDFTIHQINNSGHFMIVDEDTNLSQGIISNEYTILLSKWVISKIK